MNSLIGPSQYVLSPLEIRGKVVAIGDFNGDRFSDLIVLDGFNLGVLIYKQESMYSPFKSLLKLPFEHAVNFAASDFNKDGFLDMMISVEFNTHLENHIYLGDGDALKSLPLVFKSSKQQPFIADIFGKMESNLVGYLPNGGDLTVWRVNNTWITPNTFNLTDNLTGRRACAFADPNSNAFIDIDGDCLAGNIKRTNHRFVYNLWHKGFAYL